MSALCRGFRMSRFGFDTDKPNTTYCIECSRPREEHTEEELRLSNAFLEGIENSKPRAARESAMAGARRRRRFQKPRPGPAAKEETT